VSTATPAPPSDQTPPRQLDDPDGGNANYWFSNTAILSVEHLDADEIVTSADFDADLKDTLDRLGLNPGMLENVAGIKERRWFGVDTTFSEAAAQAGALALKSAGVGADQIGLLIDTSVCRARLEPSSAVFVHNALGLPANCLNFDLSNACLGFVNGMQIAGMMIESGQIDFALIVDAEGSRAVQERTIARLQSPETTAADIFSDFATLTLGSGAAAMVLGRLDTHPDGHRVVGGVGRAATEHHDLCKGDLERMTTDTRALLLAGLDVAEVTMNDARNHFEWTSMDHYILHQISTVHCDALIARLGIEGDRVPRSFPLRGNIGPAAIPITLSLHKDQINAGDRILLMGMGSGINAAAVEIVW
jgi:3-oxoacyl-[acyl-carrier-protein] synthase III